MALNLSTENIARECARHPWRTILSWIMLFVFGGLLTLFMLAKNLTASILLTNSPESQRADDLLAERFPTAAGAKELVILRSRGFTVDDKQFQRRLDDICAELSVLEEEGIIQQVNCYDPGIRSLPMITSSLRQLSLVLSRLAGDVPSEPEELRSSASDLRAAAQALRERAGYLRYVDSASAVAIADQLVKLADGNDTAADQIEQAADGLDIARALTQLSDTLHQLSGVLSLLIADSSPAPDTLRTSAGDLHATADNLRVTADHLCTLESADARTVADQILQSADGDDQTADQLEQAATALEIAPALTQLANSLHQLSAALGQVLVGTPATVDDLKTAASSLRDTAAGIRSTGWYLNRLGAPEAKEVGIKLLLAAQGQEEAANGLQQAAAALELYATLGQASDNLEQTSQWAHDQIQQLVEDKPTWWALRTALLSIPACVADALAPLAESAAQQIDQGFAAEKPQIEGGIQQAEEGARQAEAGVLEIVGQMANGRPEIEGGIQQAEDGAQQAEDGVARIYREFAVGKGELLAGIAEAEVGAQQAEDGLSLAESNLVSKDRDTTLVIVVMSGSQNEAASNVERLHEAVMVSKDNLDSDGYDEEGFQVFVTGDASVTRDFFDIAESDLMKSDAVGLPIALVILAVVFGTVASALIPIGLGLVAIVVALGITAVIGQSIELSFSITNIVFMTGLAIGIDYCLFIVSRYREERREGHDKSEAIAIAGSTASRAVLFSGMTVILAMLGILIVPSTLHRSLAIGAVMVVVIAVLAAMTLLPAVLSLLGDKINYWRVPFIKHETAKRRRGDRGGVWDWMTRGVMRQPVLSLVLAAGLLALCSIPVIYMQLGQSYVDTLPQGSVSGSGLKVLGEEFSASLMAPIQIVIDDYEQQVVRDRTETLMLELDGTSDFDVPPQIEVNEQGDLALMTVLMTGDPFSAKASALVKQVRDEYVPENFSDVKTQVLVTGYPAFIVDFTTTTELYTPAIFAFVLGLSFVLLMVVFRSLVIPVTSIVMNLLSVGAAYGLIVLVFQKGIGADLFGFQRLETIDAWIPVFLFCILFGLSMDYQVFLLSRIRERYDQTGQNSESVAFGIRNTAGLITGAALIMLAVFIAFSRGQIVIMQEMGFGLAMAVFMDATIVRVVLVPSVMKIMGKWNWFFPSWLKWVPDVRVEAEPEENRAEQP